MTHRTLDDAMSVTPQIAPDDVPGLVAQGITLVICNRPDDEVPPELSAEALRAACEAAGLTFILNPLAPGGLTGEAVAAQDQAITSADGPVLAYCASGTRSAILWAFASAGAGRHNIDFIVEALANAGYSFPGIANQLEAFAASAH